MNIQREDRDVFSDAERPRDPDSRGQDLARTGSRVCRNGIREIRARMEEEKTVNVPYPDMIIIHPLRTRK